MQYIILSHEPKLEELAEIHQSTDCSILFVDLLCLVIYYVHLGLFYVLSHSMTFLLKGVLYESFLKT